MSAPMHRNTFEIEAEYLHLFVGRRIIIWDDKVGATLTVAAVRNEPEHHRVLAEVETSAEPLEVEFVPGDVVEVEHERAVAL